MRRVSKVQVFVGVILGACLFIGYVLTRDSGDGEIRTADGDGAIRTTDAAASSGPRGDHKTENQTPEVPAIDSPTKLTVAPPPLHDSPATPEPKTQSRRRPNIETAFAPTPTSGGLLIRLAQRPSEFEVIAAAVPFLRDHRTPGWGSGLPPAPRTMRTRSDGESAFVPYLGIDRISCWVRAGTTGAVFDNLSSAVPPAPPNEITLDLRSADNRGVVIGSARFTDGRPAVGFDIRVNPGGSSKWSAPLDVYTSADFRAAMGQTTTTDLNGDFEVIGLPIGEGALIALSLRGQVLVGAQGVAIASGRDRAQHIVLTVPFGSTRTVAVMCRNRRVPGLALSVEAEGIPLSGIRCDKYGKATFFVPDAARTVTVGFPTSVFHRQREIGHALASAGFPSALQSRLFDLLSTVASHSRRVFERTHDPDGIWNIDLTAALTRFVVDADPMVSLRAELLRSIEESRTVSVSIRQAIEAGNIDTVFIQFIDVLGTAAAALLGR